jgi:iron complex outermembrane receptor protein
MTKRTRATAIATTILTSLTGAGLALAASGAPSGLEEIVVTAQKREQKVQEVPLAVQVLGSAQLAAASVREFTDLTRLSPNLVIRQDVQPVNATVSIRGVGTNAFGIGVEPSVAIVVDDVPLAFQARAFSDLQDIERIEVLSGPQSTLYGKSASAGLINIVTGAPSKTFTASGSVIATSDSEDGGKLVLSGPITPDIGFHIATNYNKYEGNIDNLFYNHSINGHETFSTRGKLTWDVNQKINLTLGSDYINGSTTVGRPFVNLSPNANLRNNAAWTPSVWGAGINFGPDNTAVINNYETTTNYFGVGESFKGNIDLGGVTLLSITSHAHFKLLDHQDIDESGIAAIDNQQIGTFANSQWTQELRLVSAADRAFRYTVGGFYADVGYIRHFLRGPFYSLANWDATSGSQQMSVFGQVDYDILPKLTLIGGLRVGNEKIDYTFVDHLANNAAFSGNHSETYTAYKAGAQYHFNDDINGFITVSSGHKGATYDLTTGFNALRAAGGPVNPESSTDYELGLRTRLMGGSLTVNPTLFQTDYTDFQAQGASILPDGTVNFRLTNVGKLRTRGFELENALRVNDDLTVGLSGAYLSAIITSYPNAQCYPAQTLAQGCFGSPAHQSISGATAPNAPKVKVTANFDWAHPVGGGSLETIIKGSYTYQTRINFALTQDPQTVQKAYGVLNLSAGVRDTVRKYEIIAFVNNALGTRYYAGLVNSLTAYGNQTALQAIIPRDFKTYGGVQLSYKY